MDFSMLLKNVSKHISTGDDEDFFLAMLQQRSLKKGANVLSEGQPCEHIHFVNKGILRAYHLSPEGKESTVMFAMKDWWITDMANFVEGSPALINIEAVESGEVLSLSRDNFDRLVTEAPRFEKFFRILFQNAYVREQTRSIEILTLTAEQRYERFTQKYPELCSKITQKQIASYLGITPEFLSSIRAQRK